MGYKIGPPRQIFKEKLVNKNTIIPKIRDPLASDIVQKALAPYAKV
jgi:hypothetical protein